MDVLLEPQTIIAFFTLVSLELVLGIDNVIFISILAGKLQKNEQSQARTIGMALAVFFRIIMLFFLSWIIGLTDPLFSILEHQVSGRDLILLIGGLFLLGKSTHEIHQKLEGEEGQSSSQVKPKLISVIIQILIIIY